MVHFKCNFLLFVQMYSEWEVFASSQAITSFIVAYSHTFIVAFEEKGVVLEGRTR